LDQLQAGDQVRVSTELFVYTYQIRSQAIVGENDLWITQPTQASQLTLLTCTDWNAEFQLYLKRLAIFADFVSAEPIVHQGSR
jgi:LPXTG-site transpeptidase (sortase) family protein